MTTRLLQIDADALRAWVDSPVSNATGVQASSIVATLGLAGDILLNPRAYVGEVSAQNPEGLRFPTDAAGHVIVGREMTARALRSLGDPAHREGVGLDRQLTDDLPLACLWALRQVVPSTSTALLRERSSGWIIPAVVAVGFVSAAIISWRAADAFEVHEATRVREILAASQAAADRHVRILRTGREEPPGPVEQANADAVRAGARSGWDELGENAERVGRGFGSVLFGAAAVGLVVLYAKGKF